MDYLVLIPAYQPDERLVEVVANLVGAGVGKILIVDDGSDLSCATVFDATGKYDCVKITRHPKNMGKGAALRTGFQYILDHYPEITTVVTADADGQHKPEDIIRVAQVSENSRGHLILGARQFTGYIPLRSRLGNSLTRKLYNLCFNKRLIDTQTGLRAIPIEWLPLLLDLKAERYSYELEMLLALQLAGVSTKEVVITTVYELNNSSSHFRPVQDSITIYFILLKWWLKKVFS